MMDLCETPINLSQSVPANPHSQSIGHSLVGKMQRAQSVVSQRSLFSDSTSPPAITIIPAIEDSNSGSNDTPIEQHCDIVTSHTDSDESFSIAPVRSTALTSVDYMLDSSLDTSVEELTRVSNLADNSKLAPVELNAEFNVDDFSIDNSRVSSTPLKQRKRKDLSLKIDSISEMDVVICSDTLPTALQLSSALPLSPDSREIHDLLLGALDSSKVDGSSFEREISCAQQVETNLNIAATGQNKIKLSERDPNWNTIENESSPGRFDSCSKASMESVLLEYDMPEIDITHTLTQDSENSTLYNIDLSSQDPLSQTSQQVSNSILRKNLLKLCSQADMSPLYLENIDLVEGEELSEDSDPEESFIMSRQVEDIAEEQSFCANFTLKNDPVDQIDSGKLTEIFIPQVDGGTESSWAVEKQPSQKRTLGVRRRKRSKATRRVAVDNNSSEPTTTSIEKKNYSVSTSSKGVAYPVKQTKGRRLSLKRKRCCKSPISLSMTTPIAPPNILQLSKLARANNFTLKVKKVSTPLALCRQLVTKQNVNVRRRQSEEQKTKHPLHKQVSQSLSNKREKRCLSRYRLKSVLNDDQRLKTAIKCSIQTKQSFSKGSLKSKEVSPSLKSESSSVDLNKTIIEESPVDDVFSSEGADQYIKTTEETDRADENSKDMEELNTSFCSIPESPLAITSPDESTTLGSQSDSNMQNNPIDSGNDEVKRKGSTGGLSTHIIEGAVCFPEDIPTNYTSDVTKLSSPCQSESDSCLSQSSGELDSVSCDDFHLAVTSESEGELLGVEQMNESESMETENRLSSHITLKYDYSYFSLRAVHNGSSTSPGCSSTQKIVPFNLTKSSFSAINKHRVTYTLQEATEDSLILTPKICPPTVDHLMSSLSKYNLPSQRHQQPFYGDPEDVQPPK